MSKKANTINEIDQAVKFNEPIGPSHSFFTDFSGLRGEFEDKIVYNNLNVKRDKNAFRFDFSINGGNKSILFLGGMRGSGKTSELAKYAENLNNPSCFFCVTCNIDQELDMNELEYMDILILQLEQLTKRLNEYNFSIDEGIINRMEGWFSEREKEIKKALKGEVGFETGVEANIKTPFISLLNILGNLKRVLRVLMKEQISCVRILKITLFHLLLFLMNLLKKLICRYEKIILPKKFCSSLMV